MKKLLLTARETAALMGIAESSLWRIARNDRWPGVTVKLPGSRTIRFRAAAVEAYLKGPTAPTPPDQAA